MVDIFTLFLGIISVCALAGVMTKILLTPPKVWDAEDWIPFEIEEADDSDQTEKAKPHLWIE